MEHLLPREKGIQGGSLTNDILDDINFSASEEEEETKYFVPPSPHQGVGSSRPPSRAPPLPFDPSTFFPSHDFTHDLPPPSPRDPHDLTPLYHLVGGIHGHLDDLTAQMANLRTETYQVRDIVWHDHLDLVQRGSVTPFSNHPHYPSVFDDQVPPLPTYYHP